MFFHRKNTVFILGYVISGTFLFCHGLPRAYQIALNKINIDKSKLTIDNERPNIFHLLESRDTKIKTDNQLKIVPVDDIRGFGQMLKRGKLVKLKKCAKNFGNMVGAKLERLICEKMQKALPKKRAPVILISQIVAKQDNSEDNFVDYTRLAAEMRSVKDFSSDYIDAEALLRSSPSDKLKIIVKKISFKKKPKKHKEKDAVILRKNGSFLLLEANNTVEETGNEERHTDMFSSDYIDAGALAIIRVARGGRHLHSVRKATVSAATEDIKSNKMTIDRLDDNNRRSGQLMFLESANVGPRGYTESSSDNSQTDDPETDFANVSFQDTKNNEKTKKKGDTNHQELKRFKVVDKGTPELNNGYYAEPVDLSSSNSLSEENPTKEERKGEKRKRKSKFLYVQGPMRVFQLDLDSNEDGRRSRFKDRMEYYLPKRYFWSSKDLKELGYFWYNGPQGIYPGPYKIND